MGANLLHLFLFLITANSVGNLIPAVHSKCIEAQQQSLLHFNKSLVFDSSSSSKLITWNSSTDCCSWLGVTCSTNGRVVGLDISNESISCSIDSSSSLFQLEHLQSLNLADNFFNGSSIPSAIGKLTDLRYLNLSNACYSGQVPTEISRLTRLVIFDLSRYYPSGCGQLTLETPNLSMLIQNLTKLTELRLDGVNVSSQGSEWSQAISSSLPNLRVLSLSECDLSGPINPSLAKLQYLSMILLHHNYFSVPVPRFFANFTNLTSLSLKDCNMLGTFPKEIFQIASLQTIDLSSNVQLGGSLPEFPKNGSLESMHLSETSFSGELPNSIGNLKMLSSIHLKHCNFSGSAPKSIGNLTHLTQLDMSWNRFNSPITTIHWESLINLDSLDLSNNLFNGSIPSSIFSPPLLNSLLLNNNQFSGQVPEFSNTSSYLLDTLDLGNNNLEGQIPISIFNLQGLRNLYLCSNNFSGFASNGSQQPRNLSWVDLSHNSLFNFNGMINSSFLQIETLVLASNKLRAFPELLRNQSTLWQLDLSDNQIPGEIPNWIWRLKSLHYLDLSGNYLSTLEAPLPNCTCTVFSVDLGSNNIQGIESLYSSFLQIESLVLASNKLRAFPDFLRNQSILGDLDLSGNRIQGELPNWIWSLNSLSSLDLSGNSLSTLEAPLPNSISTLYSLNLNSNKLQGIHSSYSFLQLDYLVLASNKLTTFPDFLRNQSILTHLDLSDNQIQGHIPDWIWRLNNLQELNLSCNSLETLEAPLHNSTSGLWSLDLHSNQLRGPIPLFLPFANYLDYSRNNFNSSIPTNIGNFISMLDFLSLSRSNLHGTIPRSICNASGKVLDLSYNSLSGIIPHCLTHLIILDLTTNNLTGTIPDNFLEDCKLQTLDLSRNQIQGQFPKSLVNCSSLKVLNLGNNQIADTFPCLLRSISTLRMLVLRSNKFYGSIGCSKTNGTWPLLQIIDLAHNSLSGEIPGGACLTTWETMIAPKDDDSPTYIRFYSDEHKFNYSGPEFYYIDAMTTINNGLKLDMEKILTIFTLIDFSSNNFNGSIPEEIGELKSLYFLNLSGNGFTGEIPAAFGNMRQLESLDLSQNQLSGQIPQQLTILTFLSFLNLSNNQLVGRIPTGTQFSTFPYTSFEGNQGLWGPPLTADTVLPPPMSKGSSSILNSGDDEIEWDVIIVEIGFTCGFGIAVGSLLFCKRWRRWYYKTMGNILFKIFPQLEQRFGYHTRYVHVNTWWSH